MTEFTATASTILTRAKMRAKTAAQRALKSGILEAPDRCPSCGEYKALQMHHPDYARPLAVKFLCARCHVNLHKAIQKALERYGKSIKNARKNGLKRPLNKTVKMQKRPQKAPAVAISGKFSAGAVGAPSSGDEVRVYITPKKSKHIQRTSAGTAPGRTHDKQTDILRGRENANPKTGNRNDRKISEHREGIAVSKRG